MTNLSIALFNESHQRAFGCAPTFGIPEKEGPDHCPVVTVEITINGGMTAVGEASNQKLARQNAVDQLMEKFDELPHELRRAIESKLEAF
jgi:dsRNA-specific ribonuclease